MLHFAFFFTGISAGLFRGTHIHADFLLDWTQWDRYSLSSSFAELKDNYYLSPYRSKDEQSSKNCNWIKYSELINFNSHSFNSYQIWDLSCFTKERIMRSLLSTFNSSERDVERIFSRLSSTFLSLLMYFGKITFVCLHSSLSCLRGAARFSIISGWSLLTNLPEIATISARIRQRSISFSVFTSTRI